MAEALTALDLLDQLLAMDEDELAYVFAMMGDDERLAAWQLLVEAEANPYFRFRGNPRAFVQQGLGEATWSKQDEILDAIATHRRVVAAASHSTGKSHIASRAAAAVALAWPADMVRVQTTATNFRQVKGILWPYIARIHARYNFPGDIFTTAWKIGAEEIATGFSASPNNEAAISGFHATGELFLIVDEGGGIHPVLGTAFNNILTGTGHALVIGNFPTDSTDTWFNRIWNSPEWHQIRISAFDTPSFPRPGGKSLHSMEEVDAYQAEHGITAEMVERESYSFPPPAWRTEDYEPVGRCTICPPSIEAHTIAKHLTDQDWVRSIANEFGTDSAYYRSRVLAEESGELVDKTLPMSWLEGSRVMPFEPVAAGPVKLGVDVAADGGDEFVVAQMIGWRVSVPYYRAGEQNANTMDVAGVVMRHIIEAEEYHEKHGITERVRVKIDSVGIGRGVADRLIELGQEGKHGALIIPVQSSETAHNSKKFKNQRSEMWWTVRELIQPDPMTGESSLLEIEWGDDANGLRLLRQLNAPKWSSTGAGQTVVQLKAEIKKETGHSPDRADALLLAVYEPPVKSLPAIGGVAVGATNHWGAVG